MRITVNEQLIRVSVACLEPAWQPFERKGAGIWARGRRNHSPKIPGLSLPFRTPATQAPRRPHAGYWHSWQFSVCLCYLKISNLSILYINWWTNTPFKCYALHRTLRALIRCPTCSSPLLADFWLILLIFQENNRKGKKFRLVTCIYSI